LKIGEATTKSEARQPRDRVIDELLDEITSWTPRERIGAFRSWLRGSLSLIHLHVLTILEADGPISMSRLADALGVSVASMTGIIGRMEQRGLVERRHAEDDRRLVLVHATKSGVAIFRNLEEHRRLRLRAVLGKLTNEERSSLLIGLRAIRAARGAVHAEDEAAGPAGGLPSR
jgi:DNA-binding MarR family transcriptional regulator